MYLTPLDPRRVSEADFPTMGAPAEKLRFLVRYAILAPSNRNSQPWRFHSAEDCLELYADRTRALPVADPQGRELVISCGAALFYLRVALRRFGYAGVVETFPADGTPDLVARIGLGETVTPTDEDERLFRGIARRHTNRMAFADRKIPEMLLRDIRAAAQQEGVGMLRAEEGEARERLAELIAEADDAQAADPCFRRELEHWLQRKGEHREDGIPESAYGMPGLISYAGPFLVRTFDVGALHSARDRQLGVGEPILIVLNTPTDTPRDWLKTGEALAYMLLRAALEGVSASYLNAPLELPGLRPQVGALLGASGFPQLILRLGYGPEVESSPRRAAEEVIERGEE